MDPHTDETAPDAAIVEAPALDLDAIEQDLADVEVALARLESGDYWTCEVTGEPLDEDLLTASPTTRRAPGH